MEKSLIEKLRAVQDGDELAFSSLCDDYAGLIGSMTQSFSESCPDLDRDDLKQEAIMALYKAALRFRLEQTEVTFGLYAKICIKNRLISVRRKMASQSRLKSEPSIPKLDPALSPRGAEEIRRLSGEVQALLSPFEQKVFTLYANKCSYSEIARELSQSVKSVDNAVYRIKRKLRKRL